MGGVAIGGFMGTGKTTLGRRLAAALGLPFVDMDSVLVERFGSIRRQFKNLGEAVFRDREESLIEEVCQGPDVVLATGGGAWANPQNRARLGRRFTRVVLHAELSTIRARLSYDASRPLWNDAAGQLYAQRASAYQDADIIVRVDSNTVQELVREVIRRLGLPVDKRSLVSVPLGDRSYNVWVDTGGWQHLPDALLGALPGVKQAVVISDTNAALHWYGPVSAALSAAGWGHRLVTFPAGEASKTIDTWASLHTQVLQPGFNRKTAIVALGGGVVGDLAGFVAATVMRGVPFVQIPTTLLALVDSSVGGKTGLNHAGGKNLVGAFHQPRLVYGALQALTSLPDAERISGLAEVVKTALLGDVPLLDLIEERAEDLRRGDPEITRRVVTRCVQTKSDIVARDELESGVRAILNAGHTVGHAYEAVLGGAVIRHGEAVALGLIAETRWAIRTGHCVDNALADRLTQILGALGLPTTPPDTRHEALVAAMQLDKKSSSDTIGMPVPIRVGEMKLVRVPRTQLSELVSETP